MRYAVTLCTYVRTYVHALTVPVMSSGMNCMCVLCVCVELTVSGVPLCTLGLSQFVHCNVYPMCTSYNTGTEYAASVSVACAGVAGVLAGIRKYRHVRTVWW